MNEVPDNEEKNVEEKIDNEGVHKQIYKHISQREKIDKTPVDQLLNIPHSSSRRKVARRGSSMHMGTQITEKSIRSIVDGENKNTDVDQDNEKNSLIVPM